MYSAWWVVGVGLLLIELSLSPTSHALWIAQPTLLEGAEGELVLERVEAERSLDVSRAFVERDMKLIAADRGLRLPAH